MSRRDVDRREVLRLLGLGLGGGFLGACGVSGDAVLEVGPEAFRRIGEAYLEARPEDSDPERLRSLLTELRSGALREASRRDYEEERTFQVEGCVLSLTEGRLCALALLL